MPGDGLALAIRVGGQVDGRRALGRLFELGQGLGLALDGYVLRLESILHVHAQLAGGQIAHVADGGLHVIARAEVLPDGLGFGGRLHDDQRGAAGAAGARRAAGPGPAGFAGRCLKGRYLRLFRLSRLAGLSGSLASCSHSFSVTAWVI